LIDNSVLFRYDTPLPFNRFLILRNEAVVSYSRVETFLFEVSTLED